MAPGRSGLPWKGALRWAERNTARLLLAVAPRGRHIVISGFPDAEGNAIEMLRATAPRYRGTIYLLVVDPETARTVLRVAGLDQLENLRLVPRRSPEALLRFSTAEVTMFTHGLFGNPRRVPRKTLVNLWHGGGIKGGLMADDRGRPTIHSDYLVAATRQQGEILAEQCRLPDGGLLLTGNPRIDEFEDVDRSRLAAVGIDPERPFALWMPTFRRNAGHGLTAGWAEAPGDTAGVDLRAGEVVAGLAREGIQVVVKPHPSDAESHSVEGAIIVTNELLIRHGLLPYQLIGASAGLLTDYSSVWIDYLTLDRPIAFLVPDAESYAGGRGFNPPDALDWLPGPRVESPADIERFAQDIKAAGALTAPRRAEVAQRIGLVARRPVAHTILDELDARGVFGGRLSPAQA